MQGRRPPETSGIELLVSPTLRAAGFTHAFPTRRGGLDLREGGHYGRAVERLRAAMGILARPLRTCRQVHGSEVVRAEFLDLDAEPQADALVSGPGGPAVGVRTADCLPLLLADRRSGAVAAVHAGWRGCVAGVVPRAVEQLRAHWGSRPQDVLAVVGPHARVDRYEVSEDVAEALLHAAGKARTEPVLVRQTGRRPRASLRAVVVSQLKDLGIASSHIEDVGGCTISDAARFFSYRREGPHSGRHLAIIVPRP